MIRFFFFFFFQTNLSLGPYFTGKKPFQIMIRLLFFSFFFFYFPNKPIFGGHRRPPNSPYGWAGPAGCCFGNMFSVSKTAKRVRTLLSCVWQSVLKHKTSRNTKNENNFILFSKAGFSYTTKTGGNNQRRLLI
jgi:hypothetical protein